jgi:predicted metal-binding protein
MKDRKDLEALFNEHGYTDFKWIEPAEVVVSQWVRTKCMFGCGNYGHNATCPPNVPSVAEVRQLFAEYHAVVIFHFAHAVDKPEDRHAWTRGVNQELLKLEKALFLAGHYKAFLLCCDIYCVQSASFITLWGNQNVGIWGNGGHRESCSSATYRYQQVSN